MIIEFPNFLTQEECQSIIAFGESSGLRLAITGGVNKGYRKAKATWIENELILDIKKRVSELSGTELEKQEGFHFVRYVEGGEYKVHTDGEDRQKTALIYLNTGFKGGETLFPNINRLIKPEIGKLVVWDNVDSSGKINSESYHAGLPVEFGTKYIAVIWINK